MAAQNNLKDRLFADYKAEIGVVNTIIANNGTNAQLEAALSKLQKTEKEYRDQVEREAFNSCADVHEALAKHHFETISHKKITKDGKTTGIEASTKNVQIDLYKFCDRKNLDTEWYYEMQSLNKRLTLRVATELGLTTAQIREINNSYAMDKLAEQLDLGKTPTSTTQCIKHMQKVLDLLSEGEGRVLNCDFNYIMSCYTKKDNKVALRVICSKHTVLQSLLMDVFHRVATESGYGVDFKKKNEEAPKVATAEGSETKTETASEEDTIVVEKTNAAA